MAQRSSSGTIGDSLADLFRANYDERFGTGAYDAMIADSAAKRAAGIVDCEARAGDQIYLSPACERQSPPGTAERGGSRRWTCAPCLAVQAQAWRAKMLADAWDSIPERYRSDEGLRFGPKSLEVLAESVDATRNILLSGPSGAGKTALASAYLTRWLVSVQASGDFRGHPGNARFVSAYRLARARAEHRLGGGEPPLVKLALGASTLILDDLGSEPDVRDSAVGEVLYERHCEGRRTIVTTGYNNPQDAAVRYGDGIARRIWQGSKILSLPKRSAP